MIITHTHVAPAVLVIEEGHGRKMNENIQHYDNHSEQKEANKIIIKNHTQLMLTGEVYQD